jgi:hypothetical protein
LRLFFAAAGFRASSMRSRRLALASSGLAWTRLMNALTVRSFSPENAYRLRSVPTSRAS